MNSFYQDLLKRRQMLEDSQDKSLGRSAEQKAANNFMALLSQAASQAGSLGGKTATNTLPTFLQGLNQDLEEQDKLSMSRGERGLDMRSKMYDSEMRRQSDLEQESRRTADAKAKSDLDFQRQKELKSMVGPESFKAQEYADASGKTRIGKFSDRSGLIKSESDAIAPANVAAIKPPTAEQYRSAQLGKRAQDADATIAQIETSGYDPTSYSRVAENIGGFGMEPFKGGETRAYEQAAREFIAAVLRKDTGAAVTDTEFDMYYKTYFPVAGDSKQVAQQKALSRKRFADSILAEAAAAKDIIPNTPYEYQPSKGGAGTAIASPQPSIGGVKKVEEMSPEELDAEEARLKKAGLL